MTFPYHMAIRTPHSDSLMLAKVIAFRYYLLDHSCSLVSPYPRDISVSTHFVCSYERRGPQREWRSGTGETPSNTRNEIRNETRKNSKREARNSKPKKTKFFEIGNSNPTGGTYTFRARGVKVTVVN